MARRVLADVHNVEVMGYVGLTTDFARQNGLSVIVRGLRAVSDFEFEFQLANMSRHLTARNRIGVHDAARAIHIHILDAGARDRGAGGQCVRVRASHRGDRTEAASQALIPQIAISRKAVTARCGRLSRSPWFSSAAPAATSRCSRGLRRGSCAVAHKGAIASAYPLASQAGQEILAAGGNAFDAAVAVAAALAVVEPSSSGLGGGGFFLLHRQSDGFETMVDAREKAPGAASRDMYLDKAGNEIPNASTSGPLSSAIPGEPAAFEYLARKYGKLPLKQSLQPAIRLARDGFPLYARTAVRHQGETRYFGALAGRRKGVFDGRRQRA